MMSPSIRSPMRSWRLQLALAGAVLVAAPTLAARVMPAPPQPSPPESTRSDQSALGYIGSITVVVPWALQEIHPGVLFALGQAIQPMVFTGGGVSGGSLVLADPQLGTIGGIGGSGGARSLLVEAAPHESGSPGQSVTFASGPGVQFNPFASRDTDGAGAEDGDEDEGADGDDSDGAPARAAGSHGSSGGDGDDGNDGNDGDDGKDEDEDDEDEDDDE